jgi:hypothetical protein
MALLEVNKETCTRCGARHRKFLVRMSYTKEIDNSIISGG